MRKSAEPRDRASGASDVPAGEFGGPADGRLPPLSDTAGERVRDEPSVEVRFANGHDRVVNDPFLEARGGDGPLFRVVDDEPGEPAEGERLARQLVNNPTEVHFEVDGECPHVCAISLAESGPPKGVAQSVAVENEFEQTGGSLQSARRQKVGERVLQNNAVQPQFQPLPRCVQVLRW